MDNIQQMTWFLLSWTVGYDHLLAKVPVKVAIWYLYICLWFEQAYCSSIWSSPKGVTHPWAVWVFLGPRVKKRKSQSLDLCHFVGLTVIMIYWNFHKKHLELFLLTMSFWPHHMRRYPHRSHDLNESNTRFCLAVHWIGWDSSNDKSIKHLFLWGGFKIRQPKCPCLLLTNFIGPSRRKGGWH